MAPELLNRGGHHTWRSDVYSYGLILWEIAARKIPFSDPEDASLGQVLAWILQGKHDPIPENTPAKFSCLIEACRSLDPSKRPTLADIIPTRRMQHV